MRVHDVIGLVALVTFTGCPAGPGEPGPGPGSSTVLRKNLGLDLAQVTAFVALATPSPGQPLSGVATRRSALEGGPRLLALTLSGETLAVTLVEQGTPDAGEVEQPRIRSVFPTASWVLFSTPNFNVSREGEEVACSIIAARRADGALFCAPLFANNGWSGNDTETTIVANAAGDVVAFLAAAVTPSHTVDPDGVRLYRLMLGETPTATVALNPQGLGLFQFRMNAAGDLFVTRPLSMLSQTMRSEILPVDGGPAFTLQGTHGGAVSGEAGRPDENAFYVMSGGTGGVDFDGTLEVVTSSGVTFVETPHPVTLPFANGYRGLFRLSDGIYSYSFNDKRLARLVADGGVIANPTTIALTGVTNVVAGAEPQPVAGRWVFIANSGAGFKFVRHDGVSQQDIPLEANLDVRSFTVSSTGAIDFLGVRLATGEKLHGTIAAGSTVVGLVSAGVLDPDQTVAFTRID